MTQEEIYTLMWECFIPFERGLDPERKVALDSCIDAASKKLALRIDVLSLNLRPANEAQ